MSMIFSGGSAMRGCLRDREAWALRRRTALAMALLCMAQVLVKWVPWRLWRWTLGRVATSEGGPQGAARVARQIAVHVERGAARLPFATKCLPRAMALCWLLRLAGIGRGARRAPDGGRPACLGRIGEHHRARGAAGAMAGGADFGRLGAAQGSPVYTVLHCTLTIARWGEFVYIKVVIFSAGCW